jgi:hypothetical protein
VATFLTPEAIRQELGLGHVSQVLAWIHSRELLASDCSRPGSSRPLWRIRPEDFEAFLKKRSVKAPVTPERRPRKRRMATTGKRYF